MLQRFKDTVAESGPLATGDLERLRAAKSLADGDVGDWLGLTYQGGIAEAAQAFYDTRGIEQHLTASGQQLLATELQKAFKSYATAALEHVEEVNKYDLSVHTQPASSPTEETAVYADTTNATYKRCVDGYIKEGIQGNLWVAKTLSEKRDALDLLGKITKNTQPAKLTKAHARQAKAVLIALPKNRNKDLRTRELSLLKMLDVSAVSKISTSTINAYLSNFQSFMTWAVNNGHSQENVFSGIRLPHRTRDASKQRSAFTGQQLSLLFMHLEQNPDALVSKDDHKWPTLIAMFTGARLNEVAQLHTTDIRRQDGIWCFDINDNEGMKKLKNRASKRLIPVHERLLDIGLIDFYQRRSAGTSKQLFPSFSYSAQNGYGRNLGRWFNEKLLPALSLKESNLVFHSLRHSMVTILSQSDVPDIMVRAIVGHEQAGVTLTSYFKLGFKLDQLKREIDKFDF